jgi:hypothetical protein
MLTVYVVLDQKILIELQCSAPHTLVWSVSRSVTRSTTKDTSQYLDCKEHRNVAKEVQEGIQVRRVAETTLSLVNCTTTSTKCAKQPINPHTQSIKFDLGNKGNTGCEFIF